MRHWSFEVGGGRGRRGALRCIAKNVDSTANRALERTGASTVPRAHISGVWFAKFVVNIHACTVPRGHLRGSAFKGSHAVCFPGHGEGQYNNVMHS